MNSHIVLHLCVCVYVCVCVCVCAPADLLGRSGMMVVVGQPWSLINFKHTHTRTHTHTHTHTLVYAELEQGEIPDKHKANPSCTVVKSRCTRTFPAVIQLATCDLLHSLSHSQIVISHIRLTAKTTDLTRSVYVTPDYVITCIL